MKEKELLVLTDRKGTEIMISLGFFPAGNPFPDLYPDSEIGVSYMFFVPSSRVELATRALSRWNATFRQREALPVEEERPAGLSSLNTEAALA